MRLTIEGAAARPDATVTMNSLSTSDEEPETHYTARFSMSTVGEHTRRFGSKSRALSKLYLYLDTLASSFLHR